MALSIKLSTYISGGYTSPVVWRLYETGTGVFVDEHTEAGPHGVVYNFSFVYNIRDIVYTIKLYEQPGGTGVGNLIKSHDVSVSTSTITMDTDIETIVDGGQPEDPTSGLQTSPPIASLVGKEFYVVQRGVGQRRQERTPEIIINNDGSYTLAGTETFFPGDTLIIKIRAQYVVNPAGSLSASTIYRDVVLITTDYTVLGTDFGKLLVVDGALPVVTLTLPAKADIIEKVSLWIESVGSTHINVVIKAAVGETILATGLLSNTFILSRAVRAEMVKLGATLHGFTDDTDVKRRGQMEWGYAGAINRLWADGTEYVTASYPGLKKAMDTMGAGTVVTYTQWADANYKGFYALANDGLHFRVPDLRNRFIRGLRGTTTDANRVTQGPGGYQEMEVEEHVHQYDRTRTDPVGSLYESNHMDEGSARGLWTGPETFTGAYGGGETRPQNIGLIPLIII